jgi:hypothetical protein
MYELIIRRYLTSTNFSSLSLQFASEASQLTASPPDVGVLDQSSVQLEKPSELKSQNQLESKLEE